MVNKNLKIVSDVVQSGEGMPEGRSTLAAGNELVQLRERLQAVEAELRINALAFLLKADQNSGLQNQFVFDRVDVFSHAVRISGVRYTYSNGQGGQDSSKYIIEQEVLPMFSRIRGVKAVLRPDGLTFDLEVPMHVFDSVLYGERACPPGPGVVTRFERNNEAGERVLGETARLQTYFRVGIEGIEKGDFSLQKVAVGKK